MKLAYADVRVDDDGAVIEPDEIDAARDTIADHAATDVLFLCHGWNTTAEDARRFYERLAGSIADVHDEGTGPRRRLVVVGIIWPSIRWAPQDSLDSAADSPHDLLRDAVAQQIADDAARREMLALVPALEDDPAVAGRFVQTLRSTLPLTVLGEDAGAFRALRGEPVDQVLRALSVRADPLTGTTLMPGSIVDAVRNAVNVAGYYAMRQRAGLVGAHGFADVLHAVHVASPGVRLHLVGHSFGARAAAAAASSTSAPLSSLVLLQGSFSHYGFARDWDGAGADGLFAAVPGEMKGPVLVTFSPHDLYLGIPYALASRLARQVGTAIGDRNDPYGAIGRNGALKTPSSLPFAELRPVGGHYAFGRGRVSSLDATRFITGHSDVTGPEVAYAILRAMEMSGT